MVGSVSRVRDVTRRRQLVRLGPWTLVLLWPGMEWSSLDPFLARRPIWMGGSAGVKRAQADGIAGCWTYWDGRAATLLFRLARLVGRSKLVPWWAEPEPVEGWECWRMNRVAQRTEGSNG